MEKQQEVSSETPVVIIASKSQRNGMFNLTAKKNDAIIGVKTIHKDHAEKLHKFALEVEVPDAAVLGAIEKVIYQDRKPEAPTWPTTGFLVTLRGMSQPAERGKVLTGETPLAAIEAALGVVDYPVPEPLLEWDGTDYLAALDLDFHDRLLGDRPSPERLASLVARVHPLPALWWITHGRGLRLIYQAMGGLTAAELAACAALTLRSLEATATFEIIPHTRHPTYPRPDHPAAGVVQRETPTAEIGLLAQWLARDVDGARINEWLTEHGLERDRKYPHDRCPVDSGTSSHGDPVCINDSGIYCHKCVATGLCLGSRRAGFFPWSALIGGGLSPRLRTAARHLCHWEHAQYIVAEDVGLSGELAKLCFAALLKAVHGADDPRVEAAMYRGAGLLRMGGFWAPSDLSRPHNNSGLVSRLEALPAVQYLSRTADGKPEKLSTIPERLGIFQGIDDLTAYGYPRIQPIRGMKVHGQFNPSTSPGVVQAVILPEFLRTAEMQAYRPRYAPAAKRMRREEAEAIVNDSFPGICHRYLQLLIAARGCAERGVGPPPRIATAGPSGAGKDCTVKVAAALLGDRQRNVPWQPDVREFHMALYEASLNAGLVTCSEIVKLIRAKKGDLRESLNGLLVFEAGGSARLLFHGYVPLHHVPPIVINDTSFPRELHGDVQIGRRYVYAHLDRKVDWQKTAKDPDKWRTLRIENADAANAIVSSVIDDFFAGEEPMSFEDIARQLGFSLLHESGDMGLDPRDDLLALFHACCSPQAITAPGGKWKGSGWCLVKRVGDDPVSIAWENVCDNLPDGFTTSRRVKEADWAQLLGADRPVECDISANGGSALAIRFRCGNPRSPYTTYNADIPRRIQPPDGNPPSPEPPPPDPPPPMNHPSEAPPACTPLPPPPLPPMAPPPAYAPLPPMAPPPAYAPLPPAQVQHASAITVGPPGLFCPVPEPAPASRAASSGPLPVFIDVKTRSACNLDEGGRRYAAHPSTDILSVVAKIDERIIVWTPASTETLPAERLWPEGVEPNVSVDTFVGPTLPAPLVNAISAGHSFCGHNVFEFTSRIWAATTMKCSSAPAVWIDTLIEKWRAGLPESLDELANILFQVEKNNQGADLMRRLRQPDQHGNFLPFHQLNAAKVVMHSISDVLLTARIYDVVRDHAEPEVLALDRTINDRGIVVDVDLARALITIEAQDTQAACAEIEQITGGAIKGSDLRRDQHILDWLRSRGVELANMKNATVEQVLVERPELDAAVRRVLETRLSINRITTGKLEAAVGACDEDGRLRDQFVYHRAHTGRWAGRRVQLHNLPSPHPDFTDLEKLIACTGSLEDFRAALPPTVTRADAISTLVRPCFRAASGKMLIIGDFASIEARGLAWCADDAGALKLFAAGGDAYCELAAKIFGRPITKAAKRERHVGKQAELGCGYGLGADAFAAVCKESGIDLALAGVTAEAVVEGYRDAHPAIAGCKIVRGDWVRRKNGLWNDVEHATSYAITQWRTYHAGKCDFSFDRGTLVVRLPSGRRLSYRNARIESRVPGYCSASGLQPVEKSTIVYDDPNEKGRTTYGGKLTENIVQAICRDLLVAAMLQCEREGLPIVMHVHDEVVVEVPSDRAGEALSRFLAVMSTPPSWAVGFPIDVEGFIADRYCKSPPSNASVLRARNGLILEG